MEARCTVYASQNTHLRPASWGCSVLRWWSRRFLFAVFCVRYGRKGSGSGRGREAGKGRRSHYYYYCVPLGEGKKRLASDFGSKPWVSSCRNTPTVFFLFFYQFAYYFIISFFLVFFSTWAKRKKRKACERFITYKKDRETVLTYSSIHYGKSGKLRTKEK